MVSALAGAGAGEATGVPVGATHTTAGDGVTHTTAGVGAIPTMVIPTMVTHTTAILITVTHITVTEGMDIIEAEEAITARMGMWTMPIAADQIQVPLPGPIHGREQTAAGLILAVADRIRPEVQHTDLDQRRAVDE